MNPTTDTYDTVAPTFHYNHPKNYIGVPIAHAADGDTGANVMQFIVRGAGAAKQGAMDLGLLDEHGDPTDLGTLVIRRAVQHYGSAEAALEQFADWKGSSTRFVEAGDGEWALLAPLVVSNTPAARAIIQVLGEHDATGASDDLTLPQLAYQCFQQDAEVAEQIFIRDSVTLPDGDAELADRLHDADVYRTQAVCQLKGMMYHAGIVTRSGADSNNLSPITDVWALDEFGTNAYDELDEIVNEAVAVSGGGDA